MLQSNMDSRLFPFLHDPPDYVGSEFYLGGRLVKEMDAATLDTNGGLCSKENATAAAGHPLGRTALQIRRTSCSVSICKLPSPHAGLSRLTHLYALNPVSDVIVPATAWIETCANTAVGVSSLSDSERIGIQHGINLIQVFPCRDGFNKVVAE